MQQKSASKILKKITDIKNYFELSKLELKKVTWPTVKETKLTSFVVLGFVLFMSVFLGIVDLGFSKIITLILSL